MNVTDILAAMLVGFAFGWSLRKAGLTKYHKIVNVFRFTDLTVLKYMMSALVVGMIGLFFLDEIGAIKLAVTTPTYVVGNLVGGLIFGGGMALAGF